jgi:hypothetical protein
MVLEIRPDSVRVAVAYSCRMRKVPSSMARLDSSSASQLNSLHGRRRG